jgi:hypothetical protein
MTDWAAVFIGIASTLATLFAAFWAVPPRHRTPLVASVLLLIAGGIGVGLFQLSSSGADPSSAAAIPPPTQSTNPPLQSATPTSRPFFIPPAPTAPEPGSPKPGTYAINKLIYSSSAETVTLESVEVTSKTLKVTALYNNLGSAPIVWKCDETNSNPEDVLLEHRFRDYLCNGDILLHQSSHE